MNLLLQTEWDFLILTVVQVIGMISVAGAFFFVIFSKYADWEERVQRGLAGYVEDLYIKFDRMFYRRLRRDFYAMILGSTIVLGLVGFLIGLNFGLLYAFIGMGFLAIVGFKLPGIFIGFVFQHRLSKFDQQLSDALSMMTNAIRSGLSFMQVIQLLEQELPSPAKQEFAMVLKENQVGVNLNDALLNMVERVPSQDLFMIVNSVVTLSQQGGDLSEAFETISHTIRERQRVQEKIRTMSAQGVTQGVILCSLPFVMMALFYVMQPDYMSLLFVTSLGQALLLAMVVLIILGAIWIRKILTIEI